MGSDLLPHGRRNKVLALAEAHDVDVVLGKQPKARLHRGKDGVARENVRAVAFDIDLLELIAERFEQRPRMGRLQLSRCEPLPKVTGPRRAVGAQVAPADFAERALLVLHLPPPIDPLIRPDEGDLRSLRRSLADLVDEERETRAQPLPRSRSDALHDFLD